MIKIAFASSDGGVGQTTQIYNIAQYLAFKNYKVLLIDLTTQSSLSKLCGVSNAKENSENIFLGGDVEVQEVSGNIDIIPSRKTIIEVAPTLRAKGVQNVYFLLEDWFNENEEEITEYDFVMIDCEKTADAVTKNAIAASDYLCGFIIPDQFSIDAIDEIKDTLYELRNDTFDKRHQEYIVETEIVLIGNMIKPRRNASKSLLGIIDNNPLFVTWIIDAEKMFESSIAGTAPVPVIEQIDNKEQKSKILKSYDIIIEKLKG